MKFLMKVGDQLDLNASWDGGAVDGVTYQVPSSSSAVLSVNAQGVVDALSLGDGVINILSNSEVIATISFEVLSVAEYEVKQGLRDGTKTLVVEVAEVSAAPAFTLVTQGSVFGSGPGSYMSNANGPNAAFDGNLSTFFVSWESDSALPNGYIGKVFSNAVEIKKVRFKWHTAPRKMKISFASDAALSSWVNPVIFDVANYLDGSGNSIWQDVILPTPTSSYGILIQTTYDLIPATTGVGSIDRLRIYEVELYQ